MPKSLLGSLVIAHAELPPQALPKSMRPVVAAAKDLVNNPTPKTAARLAGARVGQVVHPFGAPAFRVTRIANLDGRITFAGETKDRRVVAHTVNPLTGFMPKWAVRLASFVRMAAFDITGMINEALNQHGLPTDNTNWQALISQIFRRAGVPDSGMDEAIQEAVYRAFYLRDALGKFTPTEGPDAEPLVDQVRGWVVMLMEWQARGKWEAGGQARKEFSDISLDESASNDPYSGDESGTTKADALTEEDMGGETLTPEDYAIRQSDMHALMEFRELFTAYVNKYKPAKAAKLQILLFDIIAMSSNGTEIMNKWSDATNTGYTYLRKTLYGLRDSLVRFSDAKRAPDNQLSKIIQEVKNRALSIPNVTPDMMGEEPAAGPKAPEAQDEDEAFAQQQDEPMPNPAGDEDEEFAQSLKASSKKVTVARSNKAWAGSKAHRMVAAGPSRTAVYPGGLMDNDLFRKEEQDRADAAASWNMQPGGFINRNDWYSDVWAEVITAYPSEPGSPRGPFVTYYRYEKDGTPNRQFRGKDSTFGTYLRAYSPTLPANARIVSTRDGLIRDGRKVVPPTKQARSLGGEQNLTPAEQEDFAPMPDKTASSFPDESKLPKGHMVAMVPSGSWSGGMPVFVYKAVEPRNNRPYFLVKGFGPYTEMGTWLTVEQAQPYLSMDPTYKQAADANDFRPDDPEPAPTAKTVGAKGFDPEMHDPDAEPSITFMAEHLKANGVPDTTENMQEAVAGFTEARDAHHKESSMTNTKFAGLKRIAAENPGAVIEAVQAIADKIQGMADNLKTMVENLKGGETTHVEGDAVPAEPVPGQESVTAGIEEIADKAPDQMEEALNELYTDMDESLALVENLADHLDIPLSVAPAEEEGEETETEEAPQPEEEPAAVGD